MGLSKTLTSTKKFRCRKGRMSQSIYFITALLLISFGVGPECKYSVQIYNVKSNVKIICGLTNDLPTPNLLHQPTPRNGGWRLDSRHYYLSSTITIINPLHYYCPNVKIKQHSDILFILKIFTKHDNNNKNHVSTVSSSTF